MFWCLVALVLALLVWAALWPYPVWSYDDFSWVIRAKANPDTFRQWLWFGRYDFMHRNGRIADIFGQLIFVRGLRASHIAMCLLCWSSGLVMWIWSAELAPKSHSVPRWLPVLSAVCIQMVPLMAIGWDEGLAGSSLFFMSSTVNYMGGLILFGISTLPILRRAGSRGVPDAVLYGSIPVLWLAALYHEGVAVMELGLAAAVLMLDRKLCHDRVWLRTVSISGVVAMARLAAPGLWVRRETFTDAGGHSVTATAEAIIRSITALPSTERWFVIPMLGSTVLMAWRSETGNRALTWIFALASLMWICSSSAVSSATWGHATMPIPFAAGLAACVGAAICVACGLLICRDIDTAEHSDGRMITVLFACTLAGFALSIAVGTISGRSHFFGLLMSVIYTLASLLVMIVSPRRQGRERIAFVLAASWVAVSVFIALFAAERSLGPLRENGAQWRAIAEQIHDVEAGRSHEVKIPFHLPRGDYATDWMGRFHQAPRRLEEVYELPAGTKVGFR